MDESYLAFRSHIQRNIGGGTFSTKDINHDGKVELLVEWYPFFAKLSA